MYAYHHTTRFVYPFLIGLLNCLFWYLSNRQLLRTLISIIKLRDGSGKIVPAEEEFESEELEKVHLSMGLARKRFDNCMLNSEGADFSDSVGARRPKRGFKANEIFEAEPAGSEEEETLEQRYNRLNREVKKLAAEVDKNDVSTVKREDICALDNLLKHIASRCKNGQQNVNKGSSEVGRD
uniref:Uncharacterized protein n=1 Tax=Globodera rostochiensis TaxID=31243 RepID=A0A914GW25_GLORO